MTTTKRDKTAPYKRNDRVIAAVDLGDVAGEVAEGTSGKVKLINGMTWLRYWVQFDNGVWLGNVDHAKLVPAREWEQYKVDRERRAAEAETEVAEAPAEAAGATADSEAGEGAGRIPAHLLERSRKARERLGAGG